MLCQIVFTVLIPALTIAIPYGTISQAQLQTRGSSNIWLTNQSSSFDCLCQALHYSSPSIVALTSFSNNQTCQLITSNYSSSTTFYMVPSVNSTVIILMQNFTSQIKSICCADIQWLMNQIQQSTTLKNISLSVPMGLTLDTDLDLLVVIYGNARQIQAKNRTGSMAGGRNTFTKGNAQPVSYHRGLYYVGINPPGSASSYYLYIYNTTLTMVGNMSFSQNAPQRAVWLYNSSIMCVIIQHNLTSTLVFLNWFSTSFNFTYNRTVSVPFDKPYALAKAADDTMIYVSGSSASIYQLSLSTFNWTVLVGNVNSTEIVMTLVIDSCGSRLWALMLGFGIRVYDRISGNELASWNMFTLYPTLYDMVLTSTYELYLIDYNSSLLIHYGSPLNGRCTIN